MRRQTKRSANLDLPPLPSDDEVLKAMVGLVRASPYETGTTANGLALHLGVVPANRMGNGAVKGSWSGRMSPSLRIAPRLQAFEKRGLVRSYYFEGRRYYDLTVEGRRQAECDEHSSG